MSTVLGIETSCDETGVAVVVDGLRVVTNLVASQAELHARYGGVFPEMASRQHVRDLPVLVASVFEQCVSLGYSPEAVAVTRGPGLAGALLVGVNFAKGLGMALGVPVFGVNHLEGHLYSNWLHADGVVRRANGLPTGTLPRFPHLTLIVSGGHTDLVLVRDHGDYVVLGSTCDDAAGEAFDKAARMLDLGYPGGPALEIAALSGDPQAYPLPVADTPSPLDFSFSGLKSALGRNADAVQAHLTDQVRADLAASFQSAVVRALVRGVGRALAANPVAELHVAGGVSANRALAEALKAVADVPVRVPPAELCTDNGAMIAAVAAWRRDSLPHGLDVDADASLGL